MLKAKQLVTDDVLLADVKALMWRASDALLAKYQPRLESYDVASAVLANEASSAIMLHDLAALTPELPVVDRAQIGSWVAQSHSNYWLVDPLDGEREFTQRSGDFACTLALIENGRPTFGFVVVPLQDELYCGGPAVRASRESRMGKPVMIRHARYTNRPVRVVASAAGISDSARRYLESLGSEHEVLTTSQCMKLLKIATGEADIYPCTHVSLKWHTAAAHAAHAVLEGAGGALLTDDGAPLDYSSADVQIARYVASAI